ncbi:ATP-binding protein [Streptomyces sp. uw30]|uniref:ATP-binding protein n=1 Tax=Streptomyces sp. uw30 TaxID=1828179 RepID=UPI0011CE5F2E|nr:ATP-binding protein [Streptomyces sp. uw30]TXS47898.1 ATP-binding protein [Streptomyces sp. uw30]
MRLAEAPVAPTRPAPEAVIHGLSNRALLALSATVASVPVTRAWAADVLRHWRVPSDATDSALLVIGELAANAAVHGRTDMTILLGLDNRTLRIAVVDSGLSAPHTRGEVDPDEHGRGFNIVRLLSAWTEVRDTSEGRTVQTWLQW